MIFFFVNDIVVLIHKQHANKHYKFEKILFARFKIKILKKLIWFLNIKIIRNKNQKKIWLYQNSYIEKMTIKFNFLNSKNFVVFLIETFQFFEKKSNQQQMYIYQQKIKSFNFVAIIIKLNIVFVVFKLFQYFQNFGFVNFHVVDHVIAYFYNMKFLIIEFLKNYYSNIFSYVNNVAYAY